MFCGFSFVKLSRKHHCNAPKLHYLCIKSEDKLHPGIKNERVHFILLSVCIIFASNCSDYDYKGIFFFPAEQILLDKHLGNDCRGSVVDVRNIKRNRYIYPSRRGCGSARCERHDGGGAVFDSRGLACIVSDSTYVKDKPAGCILDYNPAAGQKVKEGRIIYLTINAINIPLQVVPDVADNSSLRQAEARILASGFKLNDIQYVPGEKDWVYGVKYRDRMLAIGDKVPMGATLTLMVGDGNREVLEGDSLSADESMGNPDEAVSEGSAADESWF